MTRRSEVETEMDNRCRARVVLLMATVVLFAAGIGARLYDVQCLRAEEFRRRAIDQQQTRVEIRGRRGAVVDRQGRELAISVETQSLYAHPHRFASDAERAEAARRLAPLLESPRAALLERLRSDRPFVWLARRLDAPAAERIAGMDLLRRDAAPLGLQSEPKRFYPRGALAVHVVGFANIDQVGVEGIEKRFDSILQGDSAGYLASRDGRGGRVLRLVRPPRRQPEDLVLTLDLVLQHIVERELERAMRETGSRWAAAVAIEPASGQVLALANRPAADPERYGKATPAARRNRAVVDIYEPGSTFKIVTAAAALDRDAVRAGERFDCEGGSTRVAGHRVRDPRPHRTLTFREILEKSSNVGIIKVGSRLSPETFDDYIRRFGFGERSGIELPGERSGLLRPLADWSALSPASIAFGQEIGVTVLQMASSFATLANDGVYAPPRVVLGKRDAEGRFRPFAAPPPRRAVAARTARELTGLLEGVVLRGTGERAAVPGYRIAGKTGTAQKAEPGGGYSRTEHIASFGGYGPVGSPALALLVVLDSPAGAADDGGTVAAPVFSRIMADALAYLRVPPDAPAGRGGELLARRAPAPRGRR